MLLLLASALSLRAQNLSVLHTFAPGGFSRPGLVLTNSDGANPVDGLTWSGAMLYGAASSGGTNGSGTLFAISPSGAGFSLIYMFSAIAADGANPDGANPNGSLVLSGGTLYGTAPNGGGNGQGVVFAIGTNGSGFNPIYTFSSLNASTGANKDGGTPSAGLVLAGSTLYGTAYYGGPGSAGTVFSVNTNGNLFNALYSFSLQDPITGTNTDGANPAAPLLLWGSTIYGTTTAGGYFNNGTLFSLNINGAGFTVLHHFDTNGASPAAGLALSNNTLYGLGGTVLFAVHTNGTVFTNLYQFNASVGTALDAAAPGLNLAGGSLYGGALAAGASGYGQLFSINLNGSGFTDVYDFTPYSVDYPYTNSTGAIPNGDLVVLNSLLYGTTASGGANGNGVVFRASPLRLSSGLSNGKFVLSFPTVAGLSYTVQQNTNLAGANWSLFTNILGSGAVTQFTRPITGSAQLFFRVGQNGVVSRASPLRLSSGLANGKFVLSFPTVAGLSYTVQQITNLAGANWSLFTNVLGSGAVTQFTRPITGSAQLFFRVSQQ